MVDPKPVEVLSVAEASREKPAADSVSADAIIRLEDVSKRFGSVVALADVSLDVRPGEFLSLLGPSGCGKTTTLRLIAGFEQPTSGRILLEARDVSRVPAHRRPVNTVFQNYALFPHMTVGENVAYGPRMRRVARDEIPALVRAALEKVGLGGYEGRYPAELSGGQQQRVALARCVVNRPKVLLLDEPLGALDLKLRKQMQVELKRLHAQLGTTFVYVTHDQEEALAMSDRIAVMNAGRIEHIGSGPEVYETPRTAFVADFVGTANLLRGRVLEQAGDVVSIELGGTRIKVPSRGLTMIPRSFATVSVRPERIAVTRAAPDADNVIRATVRDHLYLGGRWSLVCDAHDGLMLEVRPPSAHADDTFDPGSEVYLSWATIGGRLLEELQDA